MTTRAKPSPIPPGLERDPIALQLQKMGRAVTRSAWLAFDRGSDDESELDPETVGMLDRMFPEEPDAAPPAAPPTPVDQAKGDALLKNLFGIKPLPIVQEEPPKG